MAIIFAADLHLAPSTWAALPDLTGDAYFAWRQIVKICCELAADEPVSLILGGDVFDKSRPDSQSVGELIQGAEHLDRNGVSMFAIQGNHDKEDPPWYALSGHIGGLSSDPVEIDGFMVAGVDSTSAGTLQATVPDIECDILVLHQLSKQELPIEGAWDFDAEWVNDSVKLLLMGDLHLPVDVPDGQPPRYYSGATYMRKIDEPKEHRVLKIRNESGSPTVEAIKLRSRPVLEFVINSDDQMAEAARKISEYPYEDPEPIRKPLVIARFNDAVDNVSHRLNRLCAPIDGEDGQGNKASRPGCFLLERPSVTGTEAVTSDEQSGEPRIVTLDGCLADVVNPEEDQELYNFVLGLLRNDPSDVMAETRKRMGVD